MHILNKIINFLLFSNLWIGVSAASLALTYNGFVPNLSVLFVFTSTVALYSFMKYRVVSENKSAQSFAAWFQTNKKIARGVQIAFSVTSLALLIKLNLQQQIGVLFLFAVALLYLFFIRKIPFIKPFFVALIWSVYCLWLPNTVCVKGCPAFTNYIEAFFLLAALTLLFEIKDMQADAIYGIKTLPLSLGIKATKLIAAMLLISSLWTTIFFHINWNLPSVIFIAEFMFMIIAVFFVIKTDKNSSEQWFYGCIDGLLIFQSLFLYLSTWI